MMERPSKDFRLKGHREPETRSWRELRRLRRLSSEPDGGREVAIEAAKSAYANGQMDREVLEWTIDYLLDPERIAAEEREERKHDG